MAIVLDGTTGITTPDLTDTSLTSGRVVYAGTSGNLTGSSGLVFDGTNLGVLAGSVTTPASKLHVVGPVRSSNSAGTLFSSLASDGVYAAGTDLYLFAPTGYSNIFYANNVERMRLPVAGGLKTSSTISVGNATPASTGAGITFPASQDASSDANTLDDYEEGTWTPTINIGGVTTGITYSVQVGSYVKVGGLCNVSGYVLLSSKGGLSGNVVFTGLPFITRNLSNNYPAPSIGAYGNLTGITAYGLAVDLGPNVTGAIFIYGNGTALSALQGANITNSFTYEFTFSYPTN